MAGGSAMVIVGNALVAAAKFGAAAATGSAAMLAAAVQSLVDAGNRALLLYGLRRAGRPADKAHPFGYGRELYFWGFVVAVLLLGLGAGASFHAGLQQLRQPQPIRHPGWNYGVLAIAVVFEAVTWGAAWRDFDRVRGGAPMLKALRAAPALFTGLLESGAAILGLAAALIGILASDQFGMLRADGAAAMVIAAVMTLAAIALANETKGLLIGEASDDDLISDVFGIAGQAGFVDCVNEVRTTHFGPADVVVNLSVDARDAWLVGDLEQGIAGLEAEIRQRHAAVSRVFVEIQRSVGPQPPLGGAAQS